MRSRSLRTALRRARGPSETSLGHSTDRLGPAEDLFYPLPLSLTHRVAAPSGRSSVDQRMNSFDLCNVRHHSVFHKPDVELSSVVPFVGSERHAAAEWLGRAAYHLKRSIGLGQPGGGTQHRVGAQSIAVLHQHVTEVAELGRLPISFAIQP